MGIRLCRKSLKALNIYTRIKYMETLFPFDSLLYMLNALSIINPQIF